SSTRRPGGRRKANVVVGAASVQRANERCRRRTLTAARPSALRPRDRGAGAWRAPARGGRRPSTRDVRGRPSWGHLMQRLRPRTLVAAAALRAGRGALRLLGDFDGGGRRARGLTCRLRRDARFRNRDRALRRRRTGERRTGTRRRIEGLRSALRFWNAVA